MQHSSGVGMTGSAGDWLAGAQHLPQHLPQQPQQQHFGYAAAEHTNMLTAIRQPLFIQTPLQAMLETMVDKLQLQAGVITALQDRVEVLERNKLTGSELLSRIQLLEGRVDAATAVAGIGAGGDSSGGSSGGSGGMGACSPFVQAKLMKQVQDLEQQVSGLMANSAQLGFRTEQVLLPRLQQVEQRLLGVSNLAGTCMAVDLMAAELGIAVPHPPLSALTNMGPDGHVPYVGGGGDTSQQQQQQQQPGQQQPPQHAGGGVLTVSRQQQIQQQLDTHKQQLEAVQVLAQQLQQQVSKLASDASAVQDQQLGVLAGLQDSLSGLNDRVTKEAALLRREFKPALQATEMQRLSLAEFSKLQGQMQSWGDKNTALSRELEAIKAKDLTELSASVAQLSRRVARIVGAPGALSETERALAAAQAELRGQLDALSARLAAHEAAEAASRALAAAAQGAGQQEQQPGRSPGKASSQVDVREAVAAAVALALQAQQGAMGGEGHRAAASRSRCLVCDRALRDGSPPRCSTAPQQQQQQQQDTELLLPFMDAFRPATAAAAAAAAFPAGRLYEGGGSNGGSNGGSSAAAAGSSGRSGSPPSRHQQQGGVGGMLPPGGVNSSGPPLGPMGPGLQAAQHRQLSAQKAGRLPVGVTNTSTTSSSRPGSHSTAAAAGGGGGGEGTAGAAHGILGLMPVSGGSLEVLGGPSAAAAAALGPGPDGLFIADLVSSNLRISAAPSSSHAAAQTEAAAAGATRAGHVAGGVEETTAGQDPGSSADSGRPVGEQQQQQHSPSTAGAVTGVIGAALRPQTAAAGSRVAGIAAVRPATAAAGSRPSSSSPLGPAGKRTPVFI